MDTPALSAVALHLHSFISCASIHRYFPRIPYNRSQPCSVSILSVSILTYQCNGLRGAVTLAPRLQEDSATLKRTSGTINGEGLYTFRVKAKDNGEPGVDVDHFDIKIWNGTDTEAVDLLKGLATYVGMDVIKVTGLRMHLRVEDF